MPTIVQNCPRCSAKNMTFDVVSDIYVGSKYDWQRYFEICSICRKCHSHVVSLISLRDAKNKDVFKENGKLIQQGGDLAQWFNFDRFITIADSEAKPLPDSLPEPIKSAFFEGVRCIAIGCPNAAGAMFRLCLDLATRGLLPELDIQDGPDKHTRRNLAPRLRWLFENEKLHQDLNDLSSAVKGNGDDGAHEGSLTAADAEDIYDFSYELLNRIYSQPARLASAAKRRTDRRGE